MDNELYKSSNSTLASSFERIRRNRFESESKVNRTDDADDFYDSNDEEDDFEVDMDVNLLKYMLESHAAQDGASGPASQLLSQLGFQMSSLLPNLRDKSSDIPKLN